MLERSRLYGLPLNSVGTPRVESFRGYVPRLALAHNFKPRVLFETVLEMFPWEGEPCDLPTVLKEWDIHASGDIGAEMLKRFTAATGVDLAPCVVGPLSKLVAGQHLVKRGSGRYCPMCVCEDGHDHGQLLWEMACVTACPLHQVRLRSATVCGAPKAAHLKLNVRPKVPFACSTCGSVGFSCLKDAPETASVQEIWVAEQVSRVGVIRPPGVGVFRPVGGVPKSVLEALFEGPILQC